jgi:broad specificity phosphatase PhoE
MRKLFIVRHGQTESNINDLVQGEDSVLSEAGHNQARALANRLKHLSFQHLFVSDYERTKQTVEPLLQKISITPEYTPLLRETKRPTEFIGMSRDSDVYLKYLQLADENIKNPEWHFSDEENFFDVMTRVRTLFARFSSLDGDILTITHGRLIIYIVLYTILGDDISPDDWLRSMHSFNTANTGITVLKYDEKKGRWILDTFNDQAHFAD